MAASPNIHATISVSSGCLCFGALHNIWNGASSPVQDFPSSRPRASGTVKAQAIEFSIAARNGTWNAFQLIDLRTNEVAAWFLAHSDVNPQTEIDKILCVSGSPYEPDSGSVFNDHKTAAERVFVINRYDWGYYDRRSKDEVVVAAANLPDGEYVLVPYDMFESAGLVDLAAAQSMVLRGKDQTSKGAQWSEGGTWLHIPGGKYMFSRFGFDDNRTAARSFLFFTTNTVFTRTVFKGLERPLRKEETPKGDVRAQATGGLRLFRARDTRQLISGAGGPRYHPSVPATTATVRLAWPLPPERPCLGPKRSTQSAYIETPRN